jgi:hypothetical protein
MSRRRYGVPSVRERVPRLWAARLRSGQAALRDQAGYASIDALVGLMILAAVLVSSVAATHGSREAADLALEFRKANELAGYLLETAPAEPSETKGQSPEFSWTMVVSEPTDTFGPSAICERRVTLRGLRDNRRFEARTSSVCPAALES